MFCKLDFFSNKTCFLLHRVKNSKCAVSPSYLPSRAFFYFSSSLCKTRRGLCGRERRVSRYIVEEINILGQWHAFYCTPHKNNLFHLTNHLPPWNQLTLTNYS